MKRLLLPATLLLAACSTPATPTTPPSTTTTTTTPTTITSSTTTTTVPTTTTTTVPTTTTSVPPADRHVQFTSILSMDVLGSSGPIVVLFHGGGWVAGEPEDIAPLARAIADDGAVVFNAPYRTLIEGGGFPMTFEDAACALRFAAAHGADYGGNPDELVVVGYSAGAQIAALVSLAGDTFHGDCLAAMSDTLPSKLIGLAGPYDTDALGPLLIPFFGTNPEVDPEPWRLGNPLSYVGSNPNLIVTLVAGDEDLLVPLAFSEYFAQRLEAAGYDVTLDLLPGVDHLGSADPSVVGDLVNNAIHSTP